MTPVVPLPIPESPPTRRSREGDSVILIEFVDDLEGDRLLQELARALGRQAAQKLFAQQDGTPLATADAGAGNGD